MINEVDCTDKKHASLQHLVKTGFTPFDQKRISKLLNNGVRFHCNANFSDPDWVRYVCCQKIDLEPGTPPSHHQHELLFSKMHYTRSIQEKIRQKILNSTLVHRAWLKALLEIDRRQTTIRDIITTSNMGLVLSMAQKCRYKKLEYGELVSEGAMALLRVTECYDYRLGYHFSTYACRAIGKSFVRLAKKNFKHNRIMYIDYDPAMEKDDTCQQIREERILETIRQIRHYVLANNGNLSEIERRVLKMRFSVGDFYGNQMTLKDIGSILGLSKERIRQIQNQAVGKLGLIVK